MNNNEIFEYEKNKLEEVVEKINKQIQNAERNFNSQKHFVIGFKEGQRGTQFIRQGLMSLYATELYKLKSIVNNPYFGRFDFKNNNESAIQTLYIGKQNIMDENNQIISHDWRSPICSMYYDYNIGDAEYTVNGKLEKGKILGKRQIVIKDGKLEKVTEQDTVTDDQVLLKYLIENSDARLKSIVATIQKEQNKIIRSPLSKNYVVQGVAGSGKTTVALHRIAYLLYNEAKNINEADFMILGPNKYFLNYISELLPDLDINNVSQSTFDEIALKCLNTKINILSKNDVLQSVLSGETDKYIIEYKNTLEYLNIIEKFIEFYIQSNLTNDIEYKGTRIWSKDAFNHILNPTILDENKSYNERIDNFIKYLIKNIKNNSNDLCHEVWQKYREEYLSLSNDNPRKKEILDLTNDIENEIKKGNSTQIKDYFKFMKVNSLNLYQMFIENIDKFKSDFPIDVDKLKKQTLERLKKKQVGTEDLAALLYIEYLMRGIHKYDGYLHLVIDEAQDISISQYYLLKKMFSKAHFDIFGDIHQSIYDYQSINNWDILNDIIFDSNAIFLDLNRSYRTTKQISDTANLVLDYLNCEPAECIARDGQKISINVFDKSNEAQMLLSQLNNLLEKKYKTISIICKDDKETKTVYKYLKNIGLNINMITDKNDNYSSGITILPSYLSKGLEFDAVILYNANDINYTEDPIDQKLLYVSITRAMHELYINYNGNLTHSLKSLINQKDDAKILKKIY